MHFSIAGPAGAIDAQIEEPAAPIHSYAVVCHPHPLFGGTMDNKVVTSVCRALNEVAIAAIRFNFRGVGASSGVFDQGLGETLDAIAVADWGAARWPHASMLAAGFSFGAYVAFKLAKARATKRLITIAPAVNRFDFAALPAPNCPWLIVQGDQDEIVEAQQVTAWAAGFEPPPHLVMLQGASHFFHGRLIELREVIVKEIRSDAGRSGA